MVTPSKPTGLLEAININQRTILPRGLAHNFLFTTIYEKTLDTFSVFIVQKHKKQFIKLKN